MSGWLSLGLGAFQQIGQAYAPGDNGVFVTCVPVSYHLSDGHVSQGSQRSFPVIAVEILEPHGSDPNRGEDVEMPLPIGGARATISCTGSFAIGDENRPPTLDNVQLWCSHQDGNWGTGRTESELHLDVSPQPTAVGTAEWPFLEYWCRLELKIPTFDNVIAHQAIHIGPDGTPNITQSPVFEYGHCDIVPAGTILSVAYDAQKHGTVQGAHQ